MSQYKKGDRVSFSYEGKEVLGVVTKGGKKTSVIEDGMTNRFNVPESLLSHSDKPLPKDPPHQMDCYDVKKYVEYPQMGEETTAFSAIITKNGRDILQVKNDGKGGCNMYWPVGGDSSSSVSLEAHSKQWLIDHGMPEDDCIECADTWTSWKATMAPYGVTAKEMVGYYKEQNANHEEQTAFSP